VRSEVRFSECVHCFIFQEGILSSSFRFLKCNASIFYAIYIISQANVRISCVQTIEGNTNVEIEQKCYKRFRRIDSSK
jgi:hypothetical protein